MRALWCGRLVLLVLVVGGDAGHANALDGPAEALPVIASCQAAGPDEGAPSDACQGDSASAEEEDRKAYIKRVLSRSPAGTDLSGKQLVRTGSGFFVAEGGALVTNSRLVDGCALISVSPTFGDMVTATPIGIDRTVDLVLLGTNMTPPGIASFTGSEGALNGQPTYVIGYPKLGTITAEPTLIPVEIIGSQKTVFSVSTMVVRGALLTGNNGSALLDSSGGVIGIVLANTTETSAATGTSIQAVSLVLPNETLQQFLREHGVTDREGLKLPPKPADRLFIDARPFVAQVGCWE